MLQYQTYLNDPDIKGYLSMMIIMLSIKVCDKLTALDSSNIINLNA